MNEPAVKMAEQIINLFQEAETEVYEGWVLKTLGSRLIVFPLYNVYPDNMDERIRACERLGNEKSAECMFRIAENTNFYLHSRLEKNRYILRERTIVGDLSITEETADRFSLYGRRESKNEDRTENIIESGTAGRVEKAPAIDAKLKMCIRDRVYKEHFQVKQRYNCNLNYENVRNYGFVNYNYYEWKKERILTSEEYISYISTHCRCV